MVSRNLPWVPVVVGIHRSLRLSKMGGIEGTDIEKEEVGI